MHQGQGTGLLCREMMEHHSSTSLNVVHGVLLPVLSSCDRAVRNSGMVALKYSPGEKSHNYRGKVCRFRGCDV